MITDEVGSVNESGSTDGMESGKVENWTRPSERTFVWEELVRHDSDPLDDLYPRQQTLGSEKQHSRILPYWSWYPKAKQHQLRTIHGKNVKSHIPALG